VLADHVERQLDELGWDTPHIVGNSLGGWVAFELERRGRARTVTGIAPAGGWTRWAPTKFEVIASSSRECRSGHWHAWQGRARCGCLSVVGSPLCRSARAGRGQ